MVDTKRNVSLRQWVQPYFNLATIHEFELKFLGVGRGDTSFAIRVDSETAIYGLIYLLSARTLRLSQHNVVQLEDVARLACESTDIFYRRFYTSALFRRIGNLYELDEIRPSSGGRQERSPT